MEVATSFLDVLQRTADQAAEAEALFRSQIAERLKILECERAFAHRRVNLMRSLIEAAAGTEDRETMMANVTTALRTRLGWEDDSEARATVISRFAPVAVALCESLSPRDESSNDETISSHVAAELTAFEAWYAETHPVSFWALFENYMPETPLVDF